MRTALIALAIGLAIVSVVVALCCCQLSGRISEQERKAGLDG